VAWGLFIASYNLLWYDYNYGVSAGYYSVGGKILLLSEFAFVRPDIIKKVAEFAVKEKWGENEEDLSILQKYIDYNFEIAYEQNLIKFAEDKSYCLWRVGHLVTDRGEPITILFVKNRLENKQPYLALFVFKGIEFDAKVGDSTVREKAPKAPRYKFPSYHANYKLNFNFDHYLSDHESRVAAALPNLTSYQRYLIVLGAIQTAHLIASQVAVPQWFRDKNASAGGYKWLLPLRITDPDLSKKPDLVAALDPDNDSREYLVRTLLPPEWAYANARAVISSIDAKISHWV
jgi:hypothetical protein